MKVARAYKTHTRLYSAGNDAYSIFAAVLMETHKFYKSNVIFCSINFYKQVFFTFAGYLQAFQQYWLHLVYRLASYIFK